MNLTGNERVLDFGCGGGGCAKIIAQALWPQGYVTCVDTSKYWLNKAKKRLCKFSNVGFLFADVSRLGIPEGFYDVVSIHFVLHDIERPKRSETVKILADKLKEGGRLVIKERTGKKHGMQAEEIEKLAKLAHLRRERRQIGKSLYHGPFYKGCFVK